VIIQGGGGGSGSPKQVILGQLGGSNLVDGASQTLAKSAKVLALYLTAFVVHQKQTKTSVTVEC
jgi:hypothetical protein